MRGRVFAFLFAPLAFAGASPAETARVCELTLERFVDGQRDLRLYLYRREGEFYHGYARVVGRDELPHRIDPTPAAPFGLYHADPARLNGPAGLADAPPKSGEIDYPKNEGVYAYHDPEYKRVRESYNRGEIVARNYDPPEPVRWDAEAGRLAGTLDVWVLSHDKVNKWGLEPKDDTIRAFRAVVAASRDGEEGEGALDGTFEAWRRRHRDRTYGKGAERFKGTLTGRWRDDFWGPRPGTEYAEGKDWSSARGPDLTGSAVDCDAEIVDSLDEARLLWVAEEVIPGGKGGGPKVEFHYTPANWASMGDGAFGGPVVAGGKVYMYLRYPDEGKLKGIPEAMSHIMVVRGAPVGRVAPRFGALMDMIVCTDARTGRTVWKRTFPLPRVKNPPSGKSGKGLTPCVYAGSVYARGHRGIYRFDADTGELVWRKLGLDRKDRSYGVTGGWSRDLSPVVIGGVLVFHVYPDTTLVGLDPETGEELWRLTGACGWNAVPTKVVLDGKEYIVTACGVDIRTKGTDEHERMVLIEPRTGRTVWETKEMGKTGVSLAVSGDLVCGNVTPGLSGTEGKGVDDRMRAGCFRVSLEGATRLWTQDEVHYPPHRATPIAHRGHFYIDSRITGFACVEALTGEIAGRHKQIYEMTGGDHNWTWHAATNGRIVTSGVLMFTSAEQGFRQMPGRLPLPVVSGYMCPVKPAIADGRLFVRTLDKLVCYDLRKPTRQ